MSSLPADPPSPHDAPDLTGAICRLSILRPEQVTQTYVEWLNDPDVNRYLEIRFRTSTLEMVRDEVAAFPDKGVYLFGVYALEDGSHIGNIRLGPVNWRHLRAGIGLQIGSKRHWGRGYASEAIALISRFGIETLGVKKLVAGVYEPNEGSTRAFEKAGFKREALLPNYWECGGERVGEVLLGLDAQDWTGPAS